MSTTPLAPGTRAISTLARATVALVIAFMAVVGVGLWRDVVRARQVRDLSASVSKLSTSVANLTAAQRESKAEAAQFRRLADAYALLASTDPAERAAAREELVALAREAVANRRRSGDTPAPATTRAPSTSQPSPAAPSTTSAPRSPTSTTRPCLSAVVARVCRP